MPKRWYDKDLHYVGQDKSIIWCSEKSWANQIKYDNKIFKSQAELARYLNISPSLLCKKIKNKTINIERINA